MRALLAVVLGIALAASVIAIDAWRSSSHPPATPRPPAASPAGTIIEIHSITVDGLSRTYRSIVPARSVRGLPLLIVLHGRGQTEPAVLGSTGFLGLAQRRQAVLALPDGEQRSWNAGRSCCGFAGAHQVPDVDFVAAVVADAHSRWSIDAQRVYLVGYSNGGKLAYDAVCEHPALFTAVATYGSVPLSPCPPGTPAMSYLLAAGAADPILPFQGKPGAHPPLPSVTQALTWLRAQDRCPVQPRTEQVGPATVRRWLGCGGGTDVESVVYPGLNHTWPGGKPGTGSPTLATMMWSFLSLHRMPGQASRS